MVVAHLGNFPFPTGNHPDGRKSALVLQMLLREITVMDACSHPHLVRLYEVHSYHLFDLHHHSHRNNHRCDLQVVEIPTRIHLVLQLAPGGELFTKLTEQG